MYFSDPQFFRYFGNIVGWITFYLPGLFQENSTNLVNVNLWTLPSEFDCYAVTAVLLIFGIIYKKSLLTVLVVVATVIFIILNGFSDFAVEPWHLAGHTVTYYFFVGKIEFLSDGAFSQFAPLRLMDCYILVTRFIWPRRLSYTARFFLVLLGCPN
jgi:peptidoglycan/LPS O-acetylase OafA/YrhL